MINRTDVLLAIDVQNDFCSGGALAVPDGEAVVPIINRLSALANNLVLTQDWHPVGHESFATSHPGEQAFNQIRLNYGNQVLWPDHCVQNTIGADFHRNLNRNSAQLIVRKGFRKSVDSYSAFNENDRETSTGLAGYLRDRGLTHLYLCGLATDYCVAWSALDARLLGFNVTVVLDACRPIDLDGSLDAAMAAMTDANVTFSRADEFF